MKKLGFPFLLALPATGLLAALFALAAGFFCVRLTRIYFAMLTLAFAQIVWAICFKWNEVTGGEQGMPEIPYPDFAWFESIGQVVPLIGGWRTAEYFYFVSLAIVAACLWCMRRIVASPFGRMLTTIRENPERAEFIGVDVRRYELAAFVLAGAFAGLAGGLFGIFNRGVFPDFAYWNKSAEVLIMTLLGGIHTFFGPAVGAAALIAEPADRVLHPVLAADPRHDPHRAAVRVSRRDRRRHRRRVPSPCAEAPRCLKSARSRKASTASGPSTV